jgi:hypothetical protein
MENHQGLYLFGVQIFWMSRENYDLDPQLVKHKITKLIVKPIIIVIKIKESIKSNDTKILIVQ